MSITNFIREKKAFLLNKVEARKTLNESNRQRKIEEYKVENNVIREDNKTREEYETLRAENKRLKKERLKKKFEGLKGFGTGPQNNAKSTNGLFGESPFSKPNEVGVSRPFGNMFDEGKKKKKR